MASDPLYDWNYSYSSIQPKEWFNVWRAKELAYPFIDALNERYAAVRFTQIIDRSKVDALAFKSLDYPKAGTNAVSFWAGIYLMAFQLGYMYVKPDFYIGSHNWISPLGFDLDPNKFDPNKPSDPFAGMTTYSKTWGKITAKYRRSIPSTKAKSQPGTARLEALGFGKPMADPYWTTPWTNAGKQEPTRWDFDTPREDAFKSGILFSHSGSGWEPVALSGQGDLVEEERIGIKKGDIFGPWILDGIRDMINQLTKTVFFTWPQNLTATAPIMVGYSTPHGPVADFACNTEGGPPYNYHTTAYNDEWFVGSGINPCAINVNKFSTISHDRAWTMAVDPAFQRDPHTCAYILDSKGNKIPTNAACVPPYIQQLGFRDFSPYSITSETVRWVPLGTSGHQTSYAISTFEFDWCTAWETPIDLVGHPELPKGQNGQGIQLNIKKGGYAEGFADAAWVKGKLSAYVYARSIAQDGVNNIFKFMIEEGPYYEATNLEHGWNSVGSQDSWDTDIVKFPVVKSISKPAAPADPTSGNPWNQINFKTCDVVCLLAIVDFKGDQGFKYQGAGT
jgi:hypothetical protein